MENVTLDFFMCGLVFYFFFNILRGGYLSVVPGTNQGDFVQVDWHRTWDKQIRFTSLGNDWRSSSCRKNCSLHEVSTLYVRASKGSASAVSQGLSAPRVSFLWTSVYLPFLSDTFDWKIVTLIERSFTSIALLIFLCRSQQPERLGLLYRWDREFISHLGRIFWVFINFSVALCKENPSAGLISLPRTPAKSVKWFRFVISKLILNVNRPDGLISQREEHYHWDFEILDGWPFIDALRLWLPNISISLKNKMSLSFLRY